MIWTTLFCLLSSTVEATPPDHALDPIKMTLSPRTDEREQWCDDPVLEAIIENTGDKPLWLDLGESEDELVVTSYSYCSSAAGKGVCEGSATGRTHDWGNLESLRGPRGTVLTRGESVSRLVRLKGQKVQQGRSTVELAVRIHGTIDINVGKVQTFKARASLKLGPRRLGSCYQVRRLTKR